MDGDLPKGVLSMVEVTMGSKKIDLPYTIRVHGVTEEMFDELVDKNTKAELIDGIMIVHSPATLRHDDVGGFVRALASFYADATEQGKLFGPQGIVHLAACRKFRPDLFYLIKTHVPKPLPDQFKGIPDWVMEILSSADRRDYLGDKRSAYQLAGIKDIWFVDLDNRKISIDRKCGRGHVEEVVARGKARSDVLTGFWIETDWLWAKELPKEITCLEQILRAR